MKKNVSQTLDSYLCMQEDLVKDNGHSLVLVLSTNWKTEVLESLLGSPNLLPGWPSEAPALAVFCFSTRGLTTWVRARFSRCLLVVPTLQPCATWSLLPLLEPSSVCQYDGQQESQQVS